MNVSLLIPAYNAVGVLPDIIADARAQNPPFKEILVYDDASTDDTARVARELGASKVIEGGANKGASFARNRLFEASSSHWIHYHDADDRLAPEYMSVVQSLAPANNEIVLCSATSWSAVTGRFGSVFDVTALDGCTDLNRLLYSRFLMGSGLYPAHLIRKVGGFREDLRGAEDYDFHIRLFLAGGRWRAIPQVLNTCRRFGDVTFTERHIDVVFADWHKVFTEYTTMMPPDTHPILATLLMENAYKLYATGQHRLAADAVELASRLGRRSVVSSHWWLRSLSRILGPFAIFRLRFMRHRSADVMVNSN